MKYSDYITANRRMWNETAAIHEGAYLADLRQRIADPEFSTFDAVEQAIFASIGLPGKAVIQLACNNGRELIAAKKAGAGRCVGVDLSDGFITQARELAIAAKVAVEFVRSSVYELPAHWSGQFHLVYITIGVFGWLPDLGGFLDVIARLLRPGGQVFIYEMHPILNLFDGDQGLVVRHPYFDAGPAYAEGEPDYMDPGRTVQAGSYWFCHTLGDILGGLLQRGLRLEHFAEHGHDISMVYAPFEGERNRPPLCYSLLATRTG